MRWLVCVVLAIWAMPATAQVDDVDLRGYIESDLRLSLPGKDGPPGEDDLRLVRSDNTARLTSRYSVGDVSAYADVSLIYRGFVDEPLKFEEIEHRDRIDPFDIESDALFVQISDFLVEGVELKLGRQIIQWGTADQFNPTSVINPLDLEDPVKFGDRVPNEMIVLEWWAPWSSYGDEMTYFDELKFQFVFVPVYRPGQLPASAGLAFTDPELFVDFVNSPLLTSFVELQKIFIDLGGDFAYDTTIDHPGRDLDESQLGGRVSWTAFDVNMSVMYYKGRSDVPAADTVGVDLSTATVVDGDNRDPVTALIPSGVEFNQETIEQLNTVFGAIAESGVTIEGTVPVDVLLYYPKIQVAGADFAASLDFIGGVGLWGEAAMYFHEEQTLTLAIPGSEPVREKLLDSGQFLKVAAGTDYSITSWWYVNLQYLHGFVDEFGEDNLNDYVVGGMDFKMFSETILLRVFGINQIQDKSWVAYPNIMATPWQNTELSLGAFIMGGAEDSKFGSPVAGQSRVFLKGKYSF